MRIIAGTARSLPLKTIEGTDTRPTTDRIKETLFNMIQNEIPGAFFLDLFAGSGQIGLEAVSRGAQYAVFVENNRKACACIENLTRRQSLFKVMPSLQSIVLKENIDLISFLWIRHTIIYMKKKFWNVLEIHPF